MRILVVQPGPAFSVADVCAGWVKGLRQVGAQVVELNLSDRLTFYGSAHLEDGTGGYVKALSDEAAVAMAAKGIETAAFEVWPDMVVVISGFFVASAIYELLRARGMITVLLHTESPYEDVRQMGRAAQVDINIVNDPTNLESFRAVNPHTWYIPHAYDPDLHRPGPVKPGCVSDFCFVGTGYPSRIAFFEQVDWTGIDVALAGNWQATDPDSPLRKHLAHDIDACCPNEEAVNLYRATKFSANLYRREAQSDQLVAGWSIGPREVELAATGVFFLRDPRPEGDEVFPMLPTFTGSADFADKLRFYLADDQLRHELAGQARGAVADRTFESNGRRLLQLAEHRR